MAKKKSYPYKMLAKEEFDELSKMTEDELLVEFLKASKNEAAGKKQKKDDNQINDLKDTIKRHRQENLPKKIIELQEEIKELKKEVDMDIIDEINDLKALNKGFSNLIKEFKEKQHAILKILKSREI